ncbi:hypothetical protein Dda_0708 [Drechslerella dactyloides]|uniref:Uncharacterized protein n=1 Tax=Drechslerella dactyloides TaxID=74499 RepID=A0AAD6J5P6_DREDA|nr:hypothetical protein Dda_0708 [Drechslerella dactyloides]
MEPQTNLDQTASQKLPAWKVPLDDGSEREVPRIPLSAARQFFAVDASGSTFYGHRVITTQKTMVEKFHAGHENDKAVTWGNRCSAVTDDIAAVAWNNNLGGTQPTGVLRQTDAVKALGGSDVWFLLTDGEVYGTEVQNLTQLALETGVLGVPAIFVITQAKGQAPRNLNISVGITFFANAPDVLILFKAVPTGELYVVAGKGCFAGLAAGNGDAMPDLESWEGLRQLAGEEEFLELCVKEDIMLPAAESRPELSSGLVKLGAEFEKDNNGMAVDVNLLFSTGGVLEQWDLEQLLEEEAFNNLAVACKTRGRLPELRAYLLAQKMQEVVVKLEDIAGASAIVAQLSDPDLDSGTRGTLREKLREAHAANRRHYQEALKTTKESEEAAHRRNVLVNSALQDLAKLEASSYTADILARSSNRARRAQTVGAKGEIQASVLDFDDPDAYRADCHVCCGDNEVMAIAVKTGADGTANTADFGLDFPLAVGHAESNKDLISSQLVCFQCTLAFNGRSLFREELAAVMPTLAFTRGNKSYVIDQLYKALTGGLRTGAPAASQLFMTVLDRTLQEKAWVADGSTDAETKQRRAMLDWMLANMLANTGCRETFNEMGEWTTYPKAIAWAARDFREHGVDSWVVGYPLAGFQQMLRFGQRLGSFDDAVVRDLRLAKVMHSLASAYLALLKNSTSADETWRQPLLDMVYARFHMPLVPIDDRGPASLVNDVAVFWDHLTAFLSADATLLAGWTPQEQERVMRRVQVLAFWLVYHQRAHTRAKTFFQNMRDKQPLAPTVLDAAGPALAASLTDPVLLSIFRAEQPESPLYALHTSIMPFTNPFGGSVLHCGFAECNVQFIPSDELPPVDADWTERQRDALRQARADHLVAVFSATDAFKAASQTGMPAVTAIPTPPMSRHSNVHVSIARVWSQQMIQTDRKLVAEGDGDAVDEFVLKVRREVCRGGRGDVFDKDLDGDIRDLVPSFLQALKVALAMAGRQGEAVEMYKHHWEENSLEGKAKYEMRVAAAMADGQLLASEMEGVKL